MDLSSRIQTYRKKAGLSQEALAEMLGVSRQALGKWESGASLPTVDNLIQLAKIFQVTVDELLTGESSNITEQVSLQEAAVRSETLEALLVHLSKNQNAKRPRPWLTGLALALSAVTLSIAIYAGVCTTVMQEEIHQLNLRIDSQNSTISSISHNLLSQMEASPQESEHYSFSYELIGYNQKTQKLQLSLRVTPREYQEEDTVEFLLTPHPGSAETLENAVTIPANLQEGQYTAEIEIPAVEDMEIYLRRNGSDNNTLQEKIGVAYSMASRFIPRIYPNAHDFTFHTTNRQNISLSGAPAVTIDLPENITELQPMTLDCNLRYGSNMFFTHRYDLEKELAELENTNAYGDSRAEPVLDGEITFYLDDWKYQEQILEYEEGKKLEWQFVLKDAAGNTYEETLSWIP